jgi:predicted phage tail protein
MTSINVHGILAKEFRSHFEFSISRPQEVFDAIASACPRFRNRLVELANQGIHYALLLDGEKIKSIDDLCISKNYQTIDLIPAICGAGSSGGIIALIAVGVLTAGVGFAAAGATAGILGSLAGVAGTLKTVGIGLALMGLQSALAPKPNMGRPSSDVSAAKQSFNFSSKANKAEQGIPVPVGYGRLRVGSVVVQSSVKSYPQAYKIEDSIDTASGGEQLVNTIGYN